MVYKTIQHHMQKKLPDDIDLPLKYYILNQLPSLKGIGVFTVVNKKVPNKIYATNTMLVDKKNQPRTWEDTTLKYS